MPMNYSQYRFIRRYDSSLLFKYQQQAGCIPQSEYYADCVPMSAVITRNVAIGDHERQSSNARRRGNSDLYESPLRYFPWCELSNWLDGCGLSRNYRIDALRWGGDAFQAAAAGSAPLIAIGSWSCRTDMFREDWMIGWQKKIIPLTG